ncbi:hypothetical protein SAMN04487944_11550 [Gracilibacillus ureilyticus]|uniref:Uncharacterized protein n=1 Tax=Gracilibacillus ureilyticus TaxID=531814 RepID=A0A1H9TXR9_9BACI|nr:hypothetical protein [Gracilibacillus ureilyticus]SES01926.1 hypothetical protein SAMN04487944_11550 [Gracilibacillus ureilyticus]
MNYWHKLVGEILTWKWLFFINFAFVSGWIKRQELGAGGISIQVGMNAWDVILPLFGDPLFHLYFILPLWLFLSCRNVMNDWDYTVHIRIGSYWKWLLYTTGNASSIIVIFILLYSVINFLVSGSLQWEMGWSEYSREDVGFNRIVYTMQQMTGQPLIAFLLQIIVYILFLITVYFVIATFYLFMPTNKTLAVLAICIYLFALISFKVFTIGWLQVTTYMFIHYAYQTFSSFVPVIGILMGVNALCLVTSYFARKRNEI